MAVIKVKGYEFNVITIKDSFNRRSLQYKNKIINILKNIDLTEDDIDIPLEPVGMKKASASASWYFDGYYLHYSYNSNNKFVENLYVVLKVIEFEVNALLNKEKTMSEFIHAFSEDKDVQEQRKKARELLGVDEKTLDLDLINKRYKDLAKSLHPDMPGGDLEKFKALNRAHKILKRELT